MKSARSPIVLDTKQESVSSEDPSTVRHTQVILNDRHTLITVVHETSDPSNWIVRQWRKSWWRNKRILSEWFIDPDQARRRAETLTSTKGHRP